MAQCYESDPLQVIEEAIKCYERAANREGDCQKYFTRAKKSTIGFPINGYGSIGTLMLPAEFKGTRKIKDKSTSTALSWKDAGRLNVPVDLGTEVLRTRRCECLAERFCIDERPPVPQHMLPFLSLFQKPGAYVHRLVFGRLNGLAVELGAELLLNRLGRVLACLVEASCIVVRHVLPHISETISQHLLRVVVRHGLVVQVVRHGVLVLDVVRVDERLPLVVQVPIQRLLIDERKPGHTIPWHVIVNSGGHRRRSSRLSRFFREKFPYLLPGLRHRRII
ncbi:hypothetical protein EJB05_20526, partial [Eragrostis curvula]